MKRLYNFQSYREARDDPHKNECSGLLRGEEGLDIIENMDVGLTQKPVFSRKLRHFRLSHRTRKRVFWVMVRKS